MDRLVGYGSDDDTETDRFDGGQQSGTSTSGSGSAKRREDTDNYDDVNMDMSEDSQSQAESEPELPPADAPPKPSREDRKQSDNRQSNRERDGDRRRRDDRHDARDSRERRDDYKHARSDRDRERRGDSSRRSHDRSADPKVPSQDEKPFTADNSMRSYDARDAASPRFVDRDRRDRDRRERGERAGRDHRDRHSQRNDRRHERRRSRSRERSQPKHSGDSHSSGSSERRSPTGGDNYRPSYKVNKKLEVMEKMGLQIKTPDGTMATAQQLRRAAGEGGPAGAGAGGGAGPLPGYYNPGTINTTKILDQVAKRKLLWSGKKSEAEEAAKWSGAKFSHDTDGKQTNKFMRLMGIKDPHAVQAAPDKAADPVKKQEELFQAMQAQYEVARATTHTMRGVGLGFSRQPL